MNLRSRHPGDRRRSAAALVRAPSDRSLQTFPPESHTDLVRRRGGLITVPRRLAPRPQPPPPPHPPAVLSAAAAAGGPERLLLNVTVERSLGPVQVVMAREKSVGDLIRASVEAYGKEKRRPLLRGSDPRCFELHYSPFSLECLRPEEKLINLGSRNFFLCSKRSPSSNSSCSGEATMEANSPLPLTHLMDFLL
ncbi:hypothetical protein BT93_E0130 [Corymbia citriodora subsp. variegata]|nr:hypothetical protein BT93_E0130 [Corymbia citriodora subsp. variegata]